MDFTSLNIRNKLVFEGTFTHPSTAIASIKAQARELMKLASNNILHRCRSLVNDINTLSSRIQIVKWVHTLREANHVVDLLAKKGQELPYGMQVFDHPPPEIRYTLILDSFGTLRMRGT
ncbi:hypothetical protein AHAS_Ahas19G0213800 [Arachis hypogaea]